MENQPAMLDFVKAMADVERLRVIGVLTRGCGSASEVAVSLGVPPRDAFDHLEYLAQVGVVKIIPAEKKQDDLYELNDQGLANLSRQFFAGQRDVYIPSPKLDVKSQKVLAAHLNADGSIKQIPLQPAKLKVLLNYLLAAFTPEVNYTEKEVNMILRRFHLDTAGLRRDLIDTGLLERESNGSRYWRPS